MSQLYDNLTNCTNALSEIVSSLNDTERLMHIGNKDTQRLKQVLSTSRVFGMIPESDLNDSVNLYQQEVSRSTEAALRKLDVICSDLKQQRLTLQSKKERLIHKLNSMPLTGSRLSKRRTLDVLKQKKVRLQYSMTKKEKERERERQ